MNISKIIQKQYAKIGPYKSLKAFILIFSLFVFAIPAKAELLKEMKDNTARHYIFKYSIGEKTPWLIEGSIGREGKNFFWTNQSYDPLWKSKQASEEKKKEADREEENLEENKKEEINYSLKRVFVWGDAGKIFIQRGSDDGYLENESFFTFYRRQIKDFFALNEFCKNLKKPSSDKEFLKLFFTKAIIRSLKESKCESSSANTGVISFSFNDENEETKTLTLSYKYFTKGFKSPEKLKTNSNPLFYRNPIPNPDMIRDSWKKYRLKSSK